MAQSEEERERMIEENARAFMFISGPATEAARVVFATVYCHEKMDSKKGTLTLSECFNERLTNTPERIAAGKTCAADYFEYSEDTNLSSPILDQKLDITFYYSAVKFFCKFENDSQHILSADALKLLDTLRKNRNTVMHLTGIVHVDDVQKASYDLLDCVEKELGGTHIDEARPQIYLLTQNARNESIDYERYKQEREYFWKKLKDKFIAGSRKELENIKFEMPANPFTTFLMKSGAATGSNGQIEKLFTPPLILNCEKQRVDFLEILAANDKGEPAAVVLLGEGSCGKSTLCHVIFEQWRKRAFDQHKIEGLDSIDLILYIKLKFTRSSSLDDFLRNEYLVEQMKNIKVETLAPLLYSLEVLCIIDGFDEKHDSADDLICDIGSCLPKSRLIITSRPEYEDDCMKALLRKSPVIWTLDGFSENEREKFATKIIPLVKKDVQDLPLCVERITSYLKSRASAFARSLKLPLTVANVVCLWLENLETPQHMDAIRTATQFQRHLLEMLKRRSVNNLSDWEKDIRLLHAIAFNQLNENQNIITKSNEIAIKNGCELCPEDLEKVLQGLLVCDMKYSTHYQPTRTYSFLSRPQMEFFGALYVSHDLEHAMVKDRPLDTYFSHSKPQRYKGMFPYLAGCLAHTGQLSAHSKTLLNLCRKARISCDDFNFWFSLLRESMRSDATPHQMLPDETLKREIISLLQETSWTLPADATIAGLKLLTCNPEVQSLTVNLDLNVTTPEELEETLEQLHAGHSELRNKPEVTLLLHDRNQGGDSSYIKHFSDWCTLVKFTGCSRETDVQYLMSCEEVNATVQDVQAFNAVAKKATQMDKLEKLTISIKFPKNHVETVGVPLQTITTTRENIVTDLNFLSLIDEDVTKTIQFIRAVLGRGADDIARPKGLNRVRFRGSLGFKDGVQIAKDLQGCVTDKVYIHSRQFLTEDEEVELYPTAADGQRKSSFIYVWNDKEIFISEPHDEASRRIYTQPSLNQEPHDETPKHTYTPPKVNQKPHDETPGCTYTQPKVNQKPHDETLKHTHTPPKVNQKPHDETPGCTYTQPKVNQKPHDETLKHTHIPPKVNQKPHDETPKHTHIPPKVNQKPHDETPGCTYTPPKVKVPRKRRPRK